MYKQYWNDYEKRAEQIRKAAQAVENGGTVSRQPIPIIGEKPRETKPTQEKPVGIASFFERFKQDDILLLALLFLLLSGEERDTTMIVILGYLLLSGL